MRAAPPAGSPGAAPPIGNPGGAAPAALPKEHLPEDSPGDAWWTSQQLPPQLRYSDLQ